MPFNDDQQETYQVSLDFITDKLDTIFEQSKSSQSAMNAAGFLLHTTLKYSRPNVEKIALMLYQEVEYEPIRAIFFEIHELLNQKRPNHPFIKSLNNNSFFSNSEKPEDIKKMLELFANSLKKDLTSWLEQKYKDKLVTHEVVLKLEELHLNDPLAVHPMP